MKRMLDVLSIVFIISGLLFVSCSTQDTAPKTEGTIEKSMLGEKAGEAMESVKETVSQKATDTMTDYTDKAKEKVYGYTAPEKEATGIDAEQAKDAMTEPEGTLGDYGKKAQDALGGFGK